MKHLSEERKRQRAVHAARLYRTAANKAAERIKKAITLKWRHEYGGLLHPDRSSCEGVQVNEYAIRRALEDFGITIMNAAVGGSTDAVVIREGLTILDAPKPKQEKEKEKEE